MSANTNTCTGIQEGCESCGGKCKDTGVWPGAYFSGNTSTNVSIQIHAWGLGMSLPVGSLLRIIMTWVYLRCRGCPPERIAAVAGPSFCRFVWGYLSGSSIQRPVRPLPALPTLCVNWPPLSCTGAFSTARVSSRVLHHRLCCRPTTSSPAAARAPRSGTPRKQTRSSSWTWWATSCQTWQPSRGAASSPFCALFCVLSSPSTASASCLRLIMLGAV